APQERTAIAEIQELVVPLRHRAFIASRVGRYEDLDDSLDLLDTCVDPGGTDLPTLTVDPKPGLSVVQATDDEVDLSEAAKSHLGEDIAVQGEDRNLGVEFEAAPGGDLGLGPAAIFTAEEDRSRQVGRLDQVAIDQKDRPKPHQRQVFHHLVAEGTGADDQHP